MRTPASPARPRAGRTATTAPAARAAERLPAAVKLQAELRSPWWPWPRLPALASGAPTAGRRRGG